MWAAGGFQPVNAVFWRSAAQTQVNSPCPTAQTHKERKSDIKSNPHVACITLVQLPVTLTRLTTRWSVDSVPLGRLGGKRRLTKT